MRLPAAKTPHRVVRKEATADRSTRLSPWFGVIVVAPSFCLLGRVGAKADTLTQSGTASLSSPDDGDHYLVGDTVTFLSTLSLFASKYGTSDVNGHSWSGWMKNGYDDGSPHLVGNTCQYTQHWSQYQTGSLSTGTQGVYGTKAFEFTGTFTAFAKSTGAFDGAAETTLAYDYAYFTIDPSD